MQSLTIAGRIGQDAEVRATNSGSVTSFSVGVSQRGKNERTNWYRCTLWGARGEKLAGYLLKGAAVTVAGSLEIGEYEGKTQLNINVADVALQGGRGERQEQPRREPEPRRDDLDDDFPPF